MSNSLCSLLLGRNYNAYNVYGFATKDVTERIMCRVECPEEFVEQEEKVEEKVEEAIISKYALKPPRDLRSKFLLAMEQKEIEKAKKKIEKQKEIERLKQIELDKPPFDELYGRRIHCWVLMLPHDRDKDKEDVQPFFIEPSTGMRHEVNSALYCSIQSVWNNVNYWVNLQDDSLGVGGLDYNLSNLEKWEHLLAGEPIEGRRHGKHVQMDEDDLAQIKEFNETMDEKHLDMPEPWSLRITVSHHDEVTRFPNGKKRTQYKRTIVEEYSAYVQEDGLVIRIFRYTDLECTDLITIEERYENRNDKMIKRIEIYATQLITEYFDRGREDNAKSNYKYDNLIESWRKIEFYYQSRFDCLEKIDHDTLCLVEKYINRADKFYYRQVQYAKRGEPPPGFLEGPRRIIMNVIERFDRDEKKKASDDISQREFDFIGRQMHLKFHYDRGKITASTRTFLKPPLTDMVDGVSFKPELTYGYQAEIGAKPPKHSNLYSLLEHQCKEEEESQLKIRYVEDQISEFLRLRAFELMSPKLDVGLFNREQNEEHRKGMIEKEIFEKTKKEREIEEDMDFLQPYLIRINKLDKLTFKQAVRVKEACIKEYRDLLVARQNDLQSQIHKQMAWLKSKHEWYNLELENLVFEEEQEYFREMNEGKFFLHTLFIRLLRHRDLVPMKYQLLVDYLEDHPKLGILKRRKPSPSKA
ncbi:PREDICTED: dynein regulatory complex subunit 7 [Nicrophorus vespilloides]|uniref:Dynein regulatory complex subunit 7 n=1 Tax=Nicrophorus vespilloides TaxID=110193 RepID=A0ABM1MYH1_NICVS|nr:PREDICTED: dynein regulatory complex subunit 7 [Nicrophorus vespilloides]